MIKDFIRSMLGDPNLLIKEVDDMIDRLKDRGFDTRDRLFRKLVEECGEYAESIEYYNGNSRKVEKLSKYASPEEKLKEEISDVILVALGLANLDGLKISDVLLLVKKKLSEREDGFSR